MNDIDKNHEVELLKRRGEELLHSIANNTKMSKALRGELVTEIVGLVNMAMNTTKLEPELSDHTSQIRQSISWSWINHGSTM